MVSLVTNSISVPRDTASPNFQNAFPLKRFGASALTTVSEYPLFDNKPQELLRGLFKRTLGETSTRTFPQSDQSFALFNFRKASLQP